MVREHAFVGTFGMQRHPDREVRHYPCRLRCSVRPASAITSSTTSAGKTLVKRPIDTKSDNRRSDSGFTHPERGMAIILSSVPLTERY